ncbi:MAG TPA: metalloregulator ArsR/SmtB family transcription factor [Bryobacteraceae bacterium]|nr:metalloregulator ArsR/SmtB family transcription factor [Bryobacteraceae bacterium]
MPRKPKAAAAPSSAVFRALGDEARLRIVLRLCHDGPLSIAGLTAGSSVTRQAITKHLRVMEAAGLVRTTWRGRESVWRLNRRRLNEASRYLEIISREWDQALGRLRDFVEDR